jgi:DUF917 family protein
MRTEYDLIQKLMISKKIMDIHNNVPRGQNNGNVTITNPELQEFTTPNSKYTIPEEFMGNTQPTQIPTNSNSKDRILSSKLPDEIKRLMIEHPIQQPNNMGGNGSVLSNELVEKAARLMNNDIANNVNPYQPKKQQVQENSSSQITTSSLDKNILKDIIRETIEEVLSENGLLVESTSKTNDVFQFRVGSHIFEGKVTKIKKIK